MPLVLHHPWSLDIKVKAILYTSFFMKCQIRYRNPKDVVEFSLAIHLFFFIEVIGDSRILQIFKLKIMRKLVYFCLIKQYKKSNYFFKIYFKY